MSADRLAALDAAVADGDAETRSAAMTLALDQWLERRGRGSHARTRLGAKKRSSYRPSFGLFISARSISRPALALLRREPDTFDTPVRVAVHRMGT